jgi:anti-sigma-K factor RskA
MDNGSPHELAAAYALDALDADERRAYETHLAACERCREDVASFRETASALAYDVDVLPLPETLEHRILKAARAERPNVVPLPRRWAIPAAALAVASVAAAVVLGIWAAHLSRAPTHQAALIADSLPAATPNKTYEAWIIAGKSVKPAGLFRGGAGRKYLRLTKSVPGGVTVAVTLERRGGVAAPTSTPLLKAKVASG